MFARTLPLAGLALLAALAGCSPTDDFSMVEAPKTNKVELSRLAHTVSFDPGQTKLSPRENARLSGFVEEADLIAGERVYLSTSRDDSVSQAREAVIRRALARHGILVGIRPESSLGQHAVGDVVTIELERYVVTPPDCPNWSKPTGGDPSNSVASNFGCATATNLGLMVANPRDLIVGRTPGPADAEVATRAIQNYRAGKPIVLPDDLSNSAAAAAGPGATGAGGAATGSSAPGG